MVPGRKFSGKLPGGEDAGVHGPAKALLGGLQAGGQFGEPGRADDDQIDVACGALPGLGHGPVNERHSELRPKRLEGFAKHVHQADGLGDQALQLGQEGAVGVRPVIDAVSLLAPGKHPCRDERRKRLLEARRAPAEMLRQVAQVPGPLGLQHRGRQQPLGGPVDQPVERAGFTHSA